MMATDKTITALFVFLNIVSYLKYTTAPAPDDADLQLKIDKVFGAMNDLETSTISEEQHNSEDCICVSHNLCSGSHINEDGIGVINIRYNDKKCESYLEKCCTRENIINASSRSPESPVSCGWRNPNGVGFRILGGTNNEASFGEFPWMIGVMREETLNNKQLSIYHCGGSLIHPRVVVTAAHCVSNTQWAYKVRAGEWDTQTQKELIPHQERNVKNIIIHPNYYSRALHNDISLLILEKAFDLSENINLLCLPTQGSTIKNGTRCWASGWGKDQFQAEGVYQVILKKIELPIVDSGTCESNLRTTRLTNYFKLHKSFVCAGGESGKDTCKGDGGGPLVCPIPGEIDRYQHIGIVAWGIGCGEMGIPGVYVNVALFRDWIDKELSKLGFDTSRYQY